MKCQFCHTTITFDDVARRCPTAARLAQALGGGTTNHRPDNRHAPSGDPCRCGRPPVDHRVQHNPQGDPCAKCHLPASSHLKVRPKRTPRITAALRARDGWKCMLCGEAFAESEPPHLDPKAITIDHIVPMWRGGPDTVANLRLAHRQCNMDRNAGELTPAQKLRDERALAKWAEILGRTKGKENA